MSFRPDIEGLRGIAVLLVVAFHAHIWWWRGGFLGVDIFFVLSGYLITALLLQELESSGTLSLVGFYARRARRLLPAAAVVVVFVVVAGIFLLSPIEQIRYSKTALATTLYASNLWFIRQSSDYFAADTANNPLLHTWSLAVEEQFYFVWPVLVWIAFPPGPVAQWPVQDPGRHFSSVPRGLHMADPNQPAMGVLRLSAASLGVRRGRDRVHGPRHSVQQQVREIHHQLDEPAGCAGRRHVVSPGGGLPRLARSDSCAGNGVATDGGRGRGFGGRGAIAGSSYPSMVRAALVFLVFVALAVADLRCSHLSQNFDLWAPAGGNGGAACRISHPARHRESGSLNRGLMSRPVLCLGLAGVLMVVSLSISLGSYRLSKSRETVPGQRLLEAVEDEFSPLSNSGCIANFGETRAHPCFFGDKQSDTTIALFGDSHAAHWFPAFEKIAQERKWKLVTFLKFACPTADVPVYNPRLGRVETECAQWRTDALKQIVALHPNLIVVGNSSSYVKTPSRPEGYGTSTAAEWEEGTRRTVAAFDGAGLRTVVFHDVPLPRMDVPVCLSRALAHHWYREIWCESPRTDALDPDVLRAERKPCWGRSVGGGLLRCLLRCLHLQS